MPTAKHLLSPYFHPTTACFIDDNESFMTGLALMLPAHMSSVAFFDPTDALEYINRPPEMPSLADRCFSAQHSDSVTAQQRFTLNIDLIEQEINVAHRFNKLSVVIVDYSMPTLNGLQLCEKINDPHIGKVLLTGVADEKMAVEAFNAGIIDRFIAKGHARASAHISEFSRDMQAAYFRSQTHSMRRTLSLSGPLFLDDPSVSAWVQKLMHKRDFCEYYMVSDPPGLVLVSASGGIAQLLLLSEQQCAAQVEFAQQHDAPRRVIARLQKRTHIGLFLEEPASYTDGEDYPWDELLTKATRLGDRQRWYAGIVETPPQPIDYDPTRASHDAWVKVRHTYRPAKASLLQP